MNNQILQFSLIELLSLIGVAQAVYVLIYILFRSGNLYQAVSSILFFLNLTFFLILIAAQSRWQGILPLYADIKWFSISFFAPLSLLLIAKMAHMSNDLSIKFATIFPLIIISYFIIESMSFEAVLKFQLLYVSSVIIGAVSLLLVWAKREFLDNLQSAKGGKERYWLIIALIFMNILLIAVHLLFVYKSYSVMDRDLVVVILAISFIYIASTSIFRIYPQVILLKPTPSKNNPLSNEEQDIAFKIENLLKYEKIYQEPNYNRSDLARELGISESILSKIVNLHFNKPVPQLLNEKRVMDAKHLLQGTDMDITAIAQEAGFNSIPTFNRVFKAVEGISPSEYRRKKT